MKPFGAAMEGCDWQRRQARSSWGAVVGEIEPDFAVVECENPGGYCRIERCCTLRSAIREAVHAFIEKLDEYTLEDLLRPKTKLRHLLGVN